jgi:hypothetical protein
LPKEKDTTPNEGDCHHGMRFWSVAWLNSRHLDDVTGSDIEVGENIRENSKLPPLLEVMFSRRRVDFQKIGSEEMVDLRGWCSL